MASEDVDIFAAACEFDDAPEGYRSGRVHLTQALGARDLAVKLLEVPPGQSLCPYHYEYEEEWLVVLEGSIELRTPEGERTLQAGAVVAFPAGPDGAHKTTNRSQQRARLLMFSSAHEPAVAVYPDSDKIGIWPGNEADELIVRRDAGVDYFEGEAD